MSVTSDSGEGFDFGRVLSQIAGLIGRNFVPFFVLALLFAGLPSLLVFFAQLSMLNTDPASGPVGVSAVGGDMATYGILISLALVLVALLPAYALQGALTRAAIDDLSGKGVSLGTALQAGLRYLFPLIGLGIVVGLGVMAGAIVFIIPGVILAVCWMVSSPALVVEKVGVFQAMQRSIALTRNHRWALFGLALLFFVAYLIISFILGLVSAGGVGLDAMAQARPTMAMGIISAIVESFAVMVSTVGIAAVYFELRRIKEGVGVSELASVFD